MKAKRLILLDFDGTITTRDTFPLFVKYDMGNVRFWFTFLYYSPLIALYKMGLFDGGSVKQRLLCTLYKGSSRNTLLEKGRVFIDYLSQKGVLKTEFLKLIADANTRGDAVAVVSASPDIWIKPFADKYGVVCLCTELEYNQELFSGYFSSENCVRQEKVKRIKEMFKLEEYSEIIAYGNSKDDEAMFAIADKFYKV